MSIKDGRIQQGFTIVELLIVIVVIAILATISIVAYNGIQARARDTERKSDMRNIHEKLQLYHIDHGHYPAVDQIHDATFVKNELDLPEGAITTPGGNKLRYCWSTEPNTYCYVPLKAALAGDCLVAAQDRCGAYALSYRLEGSANSRKDIKSPEWP